MSIEKTLERIANALETLVACYAGESPPDLPGKDPYPDEDIPKKPRKSNKEQVVGKQNNDDDVGLTKEDVRTALQALQKATTPAQAKSILKGHGASTIGNLPKTKYQQVIDQCKKLMQDE